MEHSFAGSDRILTSMTAERWEQIEKVYHVALDCAPDQRAAFIAQACNGDEDLRKEIHDLVERQEFAGGHPLDHPAWRNLPETKAGEPMAPPAPGTRFGPYEITSRIGARGNAVRWCGAQSSAASLAAASRPPANLWERRISPAAQPPSHCRAALFPSARSQ